MRMTGGEIIMERLIKEEVPYLVGIPGHGCIAMLDAARVRQNELKVIQVRHEQAAVHLADGYYRVKGSPLAVFTSIGPGALNCAVGLGAAYVDSTAVLVISGETHTYMQGRGVLQEIERTAPADLPSAIRPLVKKLYRPQSPEELYEAMRTAFEQMQTGRPGPVFVSVPMDVQANASEVAEPSKTLDTRTPEELDVLQLRQAAELLIRAQRPVILAGGGVTSARAETELLMLAEFLGAAVVTTLQAKGCFPEDHPLYAWHPGTKGTSVANELTKSADVILAVGCRFTDQTSSSFRSNMTFNIPPSSLIHLDIDQGEIGKNYLPDVAIVADASKGLETLLDECQKIDEKRDWESSGYCAEIKKLRDLWLAEIAPMRDSEMKPPTIPRFYRELRSVLDRDAIVVTSSGHAQACLLEFPFFYPRTNITSGGFSTMGFAYPAALGAKLAAPDRQVLSVVGDGDFLMTLQEMATARQYKIGVVAVVLNNLGWNSIRDLQMDAFGNDYGFATEFCSSEGESVTPDFVAAARSFGLFAERVDSPDDIGPAIGRALDTDEPALIEVMVQRRFPYSGSNVVGWWDVPIPEYISERRKRYIQEKSEEQSPPTNSRDARPTGQL